MRAWATTPYKLLTPLQGEPHARPRGSPLLLMPLAAPRSRAFPPGAPSAPLPGVSPLSPPQPSPSLFPVPPGTAGTNHTTAGAGGLRAAPRTPPPPTTARKAEAAPPPPLRADRWNVPPAAVPLLSARGERSALAALTPPSPGRGFIRPPAMAGEGRACSTAPSFTRLPKPRLSPHPAERAQRAGRRGSRRERSVLLR